MVQYSGRVRPPRTYTRPILRLRSSVCQQVQQLDWPNDCYRECDVYGQKDLGFGSLLVSFHNLLIFLPLSRVLILHVFNVINISLVNPE